MISHNYKFIHIHIPKCAGTSIEKAFGHFDAHTGKNAQDHRTLRMIEQPWLTFKSISSYSNLKEISSRIRHRFIRNTNDKNHEIVSQMQFKNYFKFSVVRNPYSRVVSWYRSVLRDNFLLSHYRIPKDIEFKDYLKKYLKNTYMMRQQVYWLKNFDGKIKLDYIGKFEEMDKVIEKIFSKVPIKKINFPHEKKSIKIDYKNYFDGKSIDLIAKYYKDDLITFNYKFD